MNYRSNFARGGKRASKASHSKHSPIDQVEQLTFFINQLDHAAASIGCLRLFALIRFALSGNGTVMENGL